MSPSTFTTTKFDLLALIMRWSIWLARPFRLPCSVAFGMHAWGRRFLFTTSRFVVSRAAGLELSWASLKAFLLTANTTFSKSHYALDHRVLVQLDTYDAVCRDQQPRDALALHA